MEKVIDVQPNDVIRTCVKVRMSIQNFQLNASNCTVNVQKLDASNFILDIANVFINDEEYSQWSYDDNYIINLVLDKLGMIKKEEE